MKVQWNPTESTVSYPLYHCPDCGSKFYGGGKTIHNNGCPTKKNYQHLVAIVGDKCLSAAKASGTVPHAWPPITLSEVEAAKATAEAKHD